jgi:hypothetical protein
VIRAKKETKNMSDRKQYIVSPHPQGWQGKAQGAERASVVAPTKEEAVRETVEIAKNHGNSQVLIKNKAGQFQEERTYGKDPYPPKG